MDASLSPPPQKLTRMPALLFTLLIPGFGLIRAGRYRRGVCWLLGWPVLVLTTSALLLTDFIPLAVGGVAFLATIGCFIWMLIDNTRPGQMTSRLWYLFLAIAAAIAVSAPELLTKRAFKIQSESMEPTLLGRKASSPDQVLVDRLCYLYSKPRRGDLIAYNMEGNDFFENQRRLGEVNVHYLSRLIGLPGERIKIRDGKVYANDQELGEKDGVPPVHYVEHSEYVSGKVEEKEYLVPDGEYFVLGDNPPNAADSRFWGFVPHRKVLGKATLIYYPLSRLGRPKYPNPGK